MRPSKEKLLYLKLEGAGVEKGCISVDDFSQTLKKLQLVTKRLGQVLMGSVSRVGPGQLEKEIVLACSLKVVAFARGSFEVCVVPATTAPESSLFGDEEPLGFRVFDKLTEGISRLSGDSPTLPSEFDYGILVAMRDMSRLVDHGVTSLGFKYCQDGSVIRQAYIDRQVRQRIIENIAGTSHAAMEIKGALREVNLEEKTFRIYRTATSQPYISCCYEDRHEATVRDALDQYVMVTGDATVREPSALIKQFRITDIEVLEEETPSCLAAEGPVQHRMTARDLLTSGLVGIWKDRQDIEDSQAFARRLREHVQCRSNE